jgi:ATP-dependent exoDNAse (exonuclease V) beta subunit
VKQLELWEKRERRSARSRNEAPSTPEPPGPPPAPLADAAARSRIREALGATLLVEAAAGTGKTTELVGRIISVLRSGTSSLGRMVAVTFTDKAAGELKLRLREEIERERERSRAADPVVHDRFTAALRELEAAEIGTIHSFCADLLRERPVQARVDPLFETAAEDGSRLLLDQAFRGWFQAALAAPPPAVRRLLRRRPEGADAEGPRDLLRGALASLTGHRDFPAPWRSDPVEREALIDRLLGELAELGELARHGEPRDRLQQALANIHRFVEDERAREAIVGARDHDGLEARLRELVRRDPKPTWVLGSGGKRLYSAQLPRSEVLARREAVHDALVQLVERVDAELAALLREELRPAVQAYEALKAKAGCLDFLDLLLRARDLVREDRGVRVELQERFTHFFIDELQDTDPLQIELLLLLAADDPEETDWTRVQVCPGKLFLVGDPKQSIYRFRRADVALYEDLKRRLLGQGAELVTLESSFRSQPAIQSAVNAAFAPAMAGSAEEAGVGYVPLRPVRAPLAEQPAVVVLPVPRPYSRFGKVTLKAIDESYPDAVGAFCAWLVSESGWRVSERGGGLRPVEPRHICLLFRRFSSWGRDVTRPYVRALEARRIPHVVVGGRAFHDREEVLALRNALVALEWPDDELAVFATLRSALFSLRDAELLAFRHRRGRLHPLRALDAEALPEEDRPVARALGALGRLYRRRNLRPLAATILELLETTRIHALLATWPTGEQALANVLQVVDFARRFEASGATSFRAFVEHLEQAAEAGEATDAPVVEEGSEGIRMMTVHKAKGLEFPVVVLADPTAPRERSEPSRHVDPVRRLWVEPLARCVPLELREQRERELRRDEEEEIRLGYVAATRARDLLVVPGLGDGPAGGRAGWLDVLGPALYPEVRGYRQPAPAPGCPRFGPESVLDRPAGAEAHPESSVAPGLHRPRRGEHGVVWWDPAALELGVEHQIGLRQRRLAALCEEESGITAEVGRWLGDRALRLARGREPTVEVDTATHLSRLHAEELPAALRAREVALAETGVDRRARPAGVRFGTLVHLTLAALPLDADAAAVRACAALQARMVGSPAEELEAAVAATVAALAHPLLRRAAASLELRRETPILCELDEGRLVEGIVDLAFREREAGGNERWVVVDFKTDPELGPSLESYRAQLRLYLEAIARATGLRATGVLLAV